jgi:hypothetical protein
MSGVGEYDARECLAGEPLRTLRDGVTLRTDRVAGLSDRSDSPRVKRDPASLVPDVRGDDCFKIDFGPSVGRAVFVGCGVSTNPPKDGVLPVRNNRSDP